MRLSMPVAAGLAVALLGAMSSVAAATKPTVLITGANRGIGLEFVRQLAARDWRVIATTRAREGSEELLELSAKDPDIIVEELDVTDHPGIDALAEKYRDEPIDVLLSNAAITPRYKSAFRPLSGVDIEMARQSFEVNALGALKVIQAFMPSVEKSEQKKVVVLSSKAGSFELSPQLPMMYEYRGSKAALNMYIHTLHFETAKKGVTAVLLSPGQVNTTPGMKLPGAIETEESVGKMLKVIDGLTPEQNGKFLNYESGEELPW